MAIPTVTSITPATGSPTGGQALEVIGTNFRIPTTANLALNPVPPPQPAVRVTFGGTEATRVEFISDTRLFVYTPKRSMPIVGKVTQGSENVDVVVENIDDLGVLIPTETVTVANGYNYLRPGVSTEDSGDYIRASMQLIDLLRSEVLSNTVLSTSVDYDPDTGTAAIDVETTPQLILTGPSMEFNAFFTFRGESTQPTSSAVEFFKGRRHRVVDMTYDVMGVSNSDVELINLQALFETVVDRNTKIDFVCDPTDPGAGTIPLELHIVQSPTYERVEKHANSDLRVFTASIVLKGFPLGVLPGVVQDGLSSSTHETTEEPTLAASSQIGENLPTTQGAPTRSPPD